MCAGKRVKMLTHNSVSSVMNARMNKNNGMANINNTKFMQWYFLIQSAVLMWSWCLKF